VSPSAVARPLRRILLIGIGCAAAAALIGIVLERTRFGPTDAHARAKIEASVRSEIVGVTAALSDIASVVAREPALFDAAAVDQSGPGVRALLDRADQALHGRTAGVFAVTAYRPSGAWPLAWSGVPSELPVERIVGPRTFFVGRGPLGLRLIFISPVLDPASRHRVGVVVSERVITRLGPISAATDEGLLAMETLVPVAVRPANGDPPASGFLVEGPDGEPLLIADVGLQEVARARASWRGHVSAVALGILAFTLIVSLPPLLRWRESFPMLAPHLKVVGLIVTLLAAARWLLWLAPTIDWTDQVFHTAALGRGLRILLRTPVDFLLSMAVAAAAVVLAFDLTERLRRNIRHRRPPPITRYEWTAFAAAQAGAGLLVASFLIGYEVLLGDTIAATSVDALHFSLHPIAPARLAFAIGLLLAQAFVFWAAVLAVMLVSAAWRLPRGGGVTLAAVTLQAAPVLLAATFPRFIGAAPSTVPALPTVLAGLCCLTMAWAMSWVRPRYRHASQALRLFAGALVLLVPAFVLYPSVHHFADRGLRRVVEEEYARQAKDQRTELQKKLSTVLQQIDAMAIPRIVRPRVQPLNAPEPAFEIWSRTALATERLASSVELYNAEGVLVDRFALNLPDYVSATERWQEPSCVWEIFEEASPFGSEERRLLHAGRGICEDGSDTPTGGSIVVNVMLDYDALPFITIRNPYNELMRPPESTPQEGMVGRSVQFVVYGWGRGSLYSSNTRAWPLDETLLGIIAQSRRPFWTTMSDGERRYSTYIQNDRVGIYVIGFPVITRLDHLINLAELTTLVGLTYAVLLILGWSVSAIGGTTAASGRALLREIRASFYRKLFLAFLAASVLPVMVLALATRTFFELQLQSSVQSDAARVASVAQRVVEEYVAQQRQFGGPPDDDIMVWLSQAIDQDVNIYQGPTLLATSERDLFTSNLLPQRTPGHVYRAIELDRLSSHVGEEVVGAVPHVLAAAPVRLEAGRAILTVPLALRQQEVDRQIDTLDRRVLLAAVLFALLGAGIGYSMAERIGDPVNRLTRATRRIARGDFTARVLETSSDELRRLVADFNRMAADLERQRKELERTHRLEAWAEMARQVAHEIKNPLTPIQLSSEHLMRVNKDKGEPLTPVLEECVTSILSQVKLLRQISAEFSSFASRPTPHPAPTSLAELIPSVIEPYITGLAGRVRIEVDVPDTLPLVVVDRVLLSRALTNMIENALHAMPGGGTLAISAQASAGAIRLSVADTGTGMDREALRRIFEPYFSTKATGTGLGLTIAKRNIELNGGTIDVQSAPGVGTTVNITLPIAG
jgi:signal transduction histidine kinase